MDLLLLLRLLTLAARLMLAAALLRLILGRGERLRPDWRAAWVAVAVVSGVVAVDTAANEALGAAAAAAAADSALVSFRYLFYHATYLGHGILSAALPAILLVFLAGGRTRRAAGVAIAAIFLVGAIATARGSLSDWDVLLTHTRIISFAGIALHLVFWPLVLFGVTATVDRYLAGFIGLRTIFVLLLPVQEVLFQLVGRAAAGQIWHVNQSLQLAMTAAQLVLVLLLDRELRARRSPPRLRALAGA